MSTCLKSSTNHAKTLSLDSEHSQINHLAAKLFQRTLTATILGEVRLI